MENNKTLEEIFTRMEAAQDILKKFKGIDYNSHAAEISKDIDNLVDMSKSVNVKNSANKIKEE